MVGFDVIFVDIGFGHYRIGIYGNQYGWFVGICLYAAVYLIEKSITARTISRAEYSGIYSVALNRQTFKKAMASDSDPGI